MSFIKNLLFGSVSNVLNEWAAGTSFRLSADQVAALSAKLGVEATSITAIENDIAALVVAAIKAKLGII